MTQRSSSTSESTAKSFADFGVNPSICEALASAGITSPFPIQELTLPLALAGADLIGQARTGTGKTLAFGIPLLQRVDAAVRRTQALVIVPTRELCVQVTDDLAQAGAKLGLDVVAVYGGKALEPQAKAVEDGAQVVVGTPGRLLDLLRRGSLTLSSVSGLVLDEADEMLDLGFLPDVEQLIEATADGRQTLLFSATMPSAVVALARRYMHKPTFLRADVEEVHVAPKTKQHFFSCHRMDKPAVVARILQAPNRGLCVVFTRTKRMADVLAEELRERGIKAAPIHSDLRQEAREKALERFRKGTVTVLVATEVAARGLDIDDVTHVVNYDCPEDEKMYLHRIGRTGRAGADGVAITMAVWNELARLEMIKKTLDITEPTHEVFSTSPILDELFDLPSRDAARPAPAEDPAADDDAAEARALLKADAAKERAADSEGDDDGGRKRRRRGGRGRGGGKDAAKEQAPAPSRAATQADASSADDTPEDKPVIARTRTRTRRAAEQDNAEPKKPAARGGGSTGDGGTSTRAAAERGNAADAKDGDADAERVRVRRRTRTVEARAADEGGDAMARSTRPAPEADEASDGSGARTRTRSRAAGQSSRGATPKDRAGGRSQGGGSRGGQTRSGGARSGDRRGQSRDSAGRGSRGGRDRARASSSGDSRGPARPERLMVEPDEARGDGRPIISRPLKIQHLP